MNKLLKFIITTTTLALVGCVTGSETTSSDMSDLPELPVISSSIDGSSSSDSNQSSSNGSSIDDTVTSDSIWFDYTTLLGTQIGVFADSSDSASCFAPRFELPWNTPDSIRHNIDTSISVATAKFEADKNEKTANQLIEVSKWTRFSVKHCFVQGGRVELELGSRDRNTIGDNYVENMLYNIRIDGGKPLIDTLDSRYITRMLQYYSTPIIF